MTAQKDELVILLHGIGRTKWSTWPLERALGKAGYQTLGINYPSRSKSIQECAEFVQEKVQRSIRSDHSKIHFAAHSMGTLVTLELLARNAFKNASRAVLIAPPYKGSEMADFLQATIRPAFRLWFGPASEQLTTSDRLKNPFTNTGSIEIGVVAGSGNLLYPHGWFAMRHTGDHDGLVSVNSTQIPGINDHITIRMNHDFLLRGAAPHVTHFMDHGRFNRASPTTK